LFDALELISIGTFDTDVLAQQPEGEVV
jgi:hypothetical protein